MTRRPSRSGPSLNTLRPRPSSRLLVVDDQERLLLFRFEHRHGPLAGKAFWATPGGALDPGESYEAAACRELFEETGLRTQDPGPEVARRHAVFQTPDGETVSADERFFLVRVRDLDVSSAGWTAPEREVLAAHRWWTLDELMAAEEQMWPEDMAALLAAAVGKA